jgi:hypothetical protein
LSKANTKRINFTNQKEERKNIASLNVERELKKATHLIEKVERTLSIAQKSKNNFSPYSSKKSISSFSTHFSPFHSSPLPHSSLTDNSKNVNNSNINNDFVFSSINNSLSDSPYSTSSPKGTDIINFSPNNIKEEENKDEFSSPSTNNSNIPLPLSRSPGDNNSSNIFPSNININIKNDVNDCNDNEKNTENENIPSYVFEMFSQINNLNLRLSNLELLVNRLIDSK